MLTTQGMEVLQFTGRNGEPFNITLACTGRCEGEVNLFISASGIKLAMLTFSVTRLNVRHVMVIGGIRGAHRDTPMSLSAKRLKPAMVCFPSGY
ncbi:VirK/YbjX family protein [Erwinia tracheiphila]|nr:DUF535 family protein [Erwinia tracheiphila]UIA83360.1 VirK/YbjX family protein [Erwinia tracheiphila]UIA91889.1 VirK/YbjX family protein [Erwinia tracheiphila]UIA96833.1 VirK/YbjX family protein [Erwinia tracheiphila]